MATGIVRHEYNGCIVQQRATDGYVCLTDMAKAEGRRVGDFMDLPRTQEFIQALADRLLILPENLVTTLKGSKRGTFAHPQVAMKFAQWVSISFELWATEVLVNVVKDQSAPPLPPADIRVVNLLGSLTALGVDISNPRFNQELQDLVMDKIIGGNKQIQGNVERWAGVAEVAEDMGYAVALVTKHRSQLGRWVAMAELQSRKEKRLCNGTQREINLYLDCPELRDAIAEFMDAKVLSTAA